MHRPGTASVSGSTINLNRTTIEEVEQYHLATLKLAIGITNTQRAAEREYGTQQQSQRTAAENAHRQHVRKVANRINESIQSDKA